MLLSFIGFGSQVNTNGIISFQRRFTEFTPQRFPLNLIPLIAPFWDDVDIRRFGNIFYRVTSDVILLQRARDQLLELFPSSGNFTPTTLFIATWDRVAQFRGGSQVSAYMTIFLLVTKTSHCNKTAWRPRLGGLISWAITLIVLWRRRVEGVVQRLACLVLDYYVFSRTWQEVVVRTCRRYLGANFQIF